MYNPAAECTRIHSQTRWLQLKSLAVHASLLGACSAPMQPADPPCAAAATAPQPLPGGRRWTPWRPPPAQSRTQGARRGGTRAPGSASQSPGRCAPCACSNNMGGLSVRRKGWRGAQPHAARSLWLIEPRPPFRSSGLKLGPCSKKWCAMSQAVSWSHPQRGHVHGGLEVGEISAHHAPHARMLHLDRHVRAMRPAQAGACQLGSVHLRMGGSEGSGRYKG